MDADGRDGRGGRRWTGWTETGEIQRFAEGQKRYEKDTSELGKAALERAGKVYADIVGQVMDVVAKKKEDELLTVGMIKKLSKVKREKELGELLGETLLTADLMAWMHFYEENADTLGEEKDLSTNLRGNDRNRFAGELSWEPMAWEEAVKFFKGLIPLSGGEIRNLAKDLSNYAFTIAGIEDARITELVHAALLDGLESGITVGEFRKRVNTLLESEGLTALSRHHIETVFHTNLHTAYSAGNWDALHDPDIEDFFPFFMYLTAGDESVRPNHQAMHRFVARRNDPVWLKWWTPNGYNCRCRIVAISKYEAELKGIEPTMYPGFEPDEGFGVTPWGQMAA